MPLCHFAFGSLYREGRLVEQVDDFLRNILLPKRLRSFVCPEFMPVINSSAGLTGDPNAACLVDGRLTFNRWVASPSVSLLPNDVWMISFVDIPLRKLRLWTPASHYGKLGVAFTDEFRIRADVKRVVYYDQYSGLAKDAMVLALHKAIQKQDKLEIEKLYRAVVEYRKPARLWPEFNGLFAALKLSTDAAGQAMFERLTYSRYREGYDFTLEKEARIVTKETTRDVIFDESEVLAVIAPNEETQCLIRATLAKEWVTPPQVIVFPQ